VTLALPPSLKYDAAGLIPVVVQERRSGDVLMVAYANALSLARTVETGLATFFSRSRQRLWQKGETSGNVLRVAEMRTDCDRDTLLMIVDPSGPVCHTGSRTCFGDLTPTAAGMLQELAQVIEDRKGSSPEASYTARLFSQGPGAALTKIGEEAQEVVQAAAGESDARLAEESADLLYHLLVVLAHRGVPLEAVLGVLRDRRRA